MPAKKSAAKKSGAKKTRTRTKGARVKKARVPMSKELHSLASGVAGTFVTGVLNLGGSVTAKDSKAKDSVQVSGKIGEKRVRLRISES